MVWKSTEQRSIAERVIAVLRSEKYSAKNYLFLVPFDLTDVPGYVEKVGPPLDLKTVADRIDSYESPDDFWKDVELIFRNAITYHTERPTSKWIAKSANHMLKILAKERKAEERKASDPTSKLDKPIKKLKLPTSASAAKKEPTVSSLPNVKKSINTKITLTARKDDSPSTTGSASSNAKLSAPKPKFRIKLNLGSKASKATDSVNAKSKETTTIAAAPAPPKTQKVSAPPPGGSRGKELPQGVVVVDSKKSASTNSKPAATAKSAGVTSKTGSTTKALSTAKSSNAKSSTSTKKNTTKRKKNALPSSGGTLDPSTRRQCSKVLLGLRRHKDARWYVSPVSDKAILTDYRAKIKNPMDLTAIQNKLQSQYKSVGQFCKDVRTVFSNALIYNTGIGPDSLRPGAIELLQRGEELMRTFLQQVPPLLSCWKLCIGSLDTLYNIQSGDDTQAAAYFFQYPVEYYFHGQHPPDYLKIIHQPMDFGTVTANLVTGEYTSVSQFASDCQLVISNCIQYYSTTGEDGHGIVDKAHRLNSVLTTQLTQLERYNSKVRSSPSFKPRPSPPAELLLSVLEDLRALQYTDKATRITEPAMGPFEDPVNLTVFSDYLDYVSEPMDLKTVELNIKAGTKYTSPEDFEYDVNLIWKNSLDYHQQRNDIHSVNRAKYATKQFKRIWHGKINAFEDPASSAPPPKKATPRISISAPRTQKSILPKSQATQGQTQSKQQTQVVSTATNAKSQPVPLHIAIAQVKEAFPLRRPYKSLQLWEGDCARYFRELMKHPWLTVAHPKFLFHVPVPTLFPDLRVSYAAKIRKPMDLTTVECSLLAGNKYSGAEDFVQDVALVFCNAIRFNKDGRDLGDPLSCAYYDASVHLLRFSRWLSLELLGIEDSEDTQEAKDGLPPFSWKLTRGNQSVARQETERIAFNEPLEKSLEGDRFTWMETECEKLLKSLRHQSDKRSMDFFIVPNYPADYAAFISKPMDFSTVQKGLKKRHYDTIGQVIADLRLIFSNAQKYNEVPRLTNQVSEQAYEAAKTMSVKLELAIRKTLLTVSDRLERERIDHRQAEREVEALDKAEEAEIRAKWKTENGGEGGEQSDAQPRTIRTKTQRRNTTDFEVPFFDEEGDGRREQSYVEVNKAQKSIFERQQREKTRLRSVADAMSSAVLSQLVNLDKKRKIEQATKNAEAKRLKMDAMEVDEARPNDVNPGQNEGNVLPELQNKSRPRFQMKLNAPTTKPRKRHAGLDGFD